MTHAIGIIPARYGSTRFPGKALASVGGVPLIQRVYERARSAKRLDEVYVATDDERIMQAVLRFGGRAVMTSATHRSGTDRVAEVARKLEAQVVMNIQGDEPLIHPEQIDHVADFLLAHPAVPMATLRISISRQEDLDSPHVIKVVVDHDGYALYFSRAPIPFIRRPGSLEPATRPTGSPHTSHLTPHTSFKHIGLYGYQRDFLLRFPTLPPTPMEQLEQLEQLRALEHGLKIAVLETPHDTIGVDVPEDVARVEILLADAHRRVGAL